jgi:hypothetical protein
VELQQLVELAARIPSATSTSVSSFKNHFVATFASITIWSAIFPQLPQSHHNIKVNGTNPLSELPNLLGYIVQSSATWPRCLVASANLHTSGVIIPDRPEAYHGRV